MANRIESQSPSPGMLRGLDALNSLLADVQTGVGPFLAIYLAGYKWNEEPAALAILYFFMPETRSLQGAAE